MIFTFQRSSDSGNSSSDKDLSHRVNLVGLLCDSDQYCPVQYLDVFESTAVATITTTDPTSTSSSASSSSAGDAQEWIIIAICEGGDKIVVWSMKRPKPATPAGTVSSATPSASSSSPLGQIIASVTLSSTQSSEFVSSACSPSTLFVGEQRKKSWPFHLLTGGLDGCLRCWKLENIVLKGAATLGIGSSNTANSDSTGDGTHKLNTTLVVKLYEAVPEENKASHSMGAGIGCIKAATFGYIATSPLINPLLSTANNNSNIRTPCVDIWQLQLHSTTADSKFTLAHTWYPSSSGLPSTNDNHPSMVCFDWLSVGDSSSVLALGYGPYVKLLSAARSDHLMFATQWRETVITDHVGLLPPSSLQQSQQPHQHSKQMSCQGVEALAWSSEGTLICASQNQLYIFTKWLFSKNYLHVQPLLPLSTIQSFLSSPLIPQQQQQQQLESWLRDMYPYHEGASAMGSNNTTSGSGDSSIAEHNASHVFELCSQQFASLPFYHPKVLLEYLAAANFDKVTVILKHLLLALKNHYHIPTKSSKDKDNYEEDTKDKTDQESRGDGNVRRWPPLKCVPLITLQCLFNLGKETTSDADDNNSEAAEDSFSSSNANKQNDPYSFLDSGFGSTSRDLFAPSSSSTYSSASALFDTPSSTSSLLSSSFLLGESESDNKEKGNPSDQEAEGDKREILDEEDVKELSELLTQIALPFVSSAQQMHLLAILNTLHQIQSKAMAGAMDPCGVRFLVAFKIFIFLRKSLPLLERPSALSSVDFAWALHSEAEETLLRLCLPAAAGGSSGTTGGGDLNSGSSTVAGGGDIPLSWTGLKSLGIALWLKNPTSLRNLIENVAKAQFMASKDPYDCTLFYLALDKKPALVALFKAVKNQQVSDFLKNNFQEEKWKTAAAKNAYVLLGKQKFELAAAFFLLGGSLKDCVDICLSKLKDYQLALLVTRLVEGDGGPTYQYVLSKHILPLALQQPNSPDTALASITYWLLKKYSDSLSVLLPSSSSSSSSSATTSTPSTSFSLGGSSLSSSYSNTRASEFGFDFNERSNNSNASSTATTILDVTKQRSSTNNSNTSNFNPSTLHLFNLLRKHIMLRNSGLQMDDIHFDLVLNATTTYADTGYALLAAEHLSETIRQHNKDKQKKKGKAPSSLGGGYFGGGSTFGRLYRGVGSLGIGGDTSASGGSADSSQQQQKNFPKPLLLKVAVLILANVCVTLPLLWSRSSRAVYPSFATYVLVV